MKNSISRTVIWSLFDSEYSTMLGFNRNPSYEVYCFGVGLGDRHIHLDLSDFDAARKELDKYPRPDYIFSSPPCETWCFVSVGNKRFFTSEPGINFYWRKKWVPFDFLPSYAARRKNGVSTALVTARIIRHYKPVYWAVENGTRSLLFSYLSECANLPGFRNLANYYSYGFEYLKPTTIYSNVVLDLRNYSPACKLPSLVSIRNGCKSKRELSRYRSRVPFGLYEDIVSQFGRCNFFPWGVL